MDLIILGRSKSTGGSMTEGRGLARIVWQLARPSGRAHSVTLCYFNLALYCSQLLGEAKWGLVVVKCGRVLLGAGPVNLLTSCCFSLVEFGCTLLPGRYNFEGRKIMGLFVYGINA